MRVRPLLAVFALALSIVALSTSSQAEGFNSRVSCLEKAELRSYLSRAFQETQFAEGALENGNRVGFFLSPAGTWTMVEYFTNGDGCIHGSGDHLLVERRDYFKRPPS